ncbi:alanine--tRNA ligase [Striga asiatica]|uniref:Alanine--tRNA ligase n=1 Tax=Striga asiatica TaxID=4170 RepID=A0A5A7QQR0_STRAF|nr:alanine--tRNA ligase [Striga asiatica]
MAAQEVKRPLMSFAPFQNEGNRRDNELGVFYPIVLRRLAHNRCFWQQPGRALIIKPTKVPNNVEYLTAIVQRLQEALVSRVKRLEAYYPFETVLQSESVQDFHGVDFVSIREDLFVLRDNWKKKKKTPIIIIWDYKFFGRETDRHRARKCTYDFSNGQTRQEASQDRVRFQIFIRQPPVDEAENMPKFGHVSNIVI